MRFDACGRDFLVHPRPVEQPGDAGQGRELDRELFEELPDDEPESAEPGAEETAAPKAGDSEPDASTPDAAEPDAS